MSIEENLAAVRRYADAWKAGDLAGIFVCYHEDFTLHYGGANPLSGVHAGKAAALQVLAEVSRRTNRKLEEIVDVGAGETRGYVLARETFTRGGESATLTRLLVYTVLEGLLHQCWLYESDQATVDRFLRT